MKVLLTFNDSDFHRYPNIAILHPAAVVPPPAP